MVIEMSLYCVERHTKNPAVNNLQTSMVSVDNNTALLSVISTEVLTKPWSVSSDSPVLGWCES